MRKRVSSGFRLRTVAARPGSIAGSRRETTPAGKIPAGVARGELLLVVRPDQWLGSNGKSDVFTSRIDRSPKMARGLVAPLGVNQQMICPALPILAPAPT